MNETKASTPSKNRRPGLACDHAVRQLRLNSALKMKSQKAAKYPNTLIASRTSRNAMVQLYMDCSSCVKVCGRAIGGR